MNTNRATQIALFLLRVVAGILFFQAGALKLFGWFGGVNGHGAAVLLMSELGLPASSNSSAVPQSSSAC